MGQALNPYIPLEEMTPLNTRDTVGKVYQNAVPAIYAIRCASNKKMFIGLASIDCGTRLREHVTKLRDGSHRNKELQADFCKYGERDFEFDALARFKKAELDKMSASKRHNLLHNKLKELIKKYKALSPTGYNKKGDGESDDVSAT